MVARAAAPSFVSQGEAERRHAAKQPPLAMPHRRQLACEGGAVLA